MHFLEAVGIYLIGELVGAGLFSWVRKLLGPKTTDASQVWTGLLKGMFERLVLVTGLIQGIPQIVIAFGALKIGTRLHDSTRISNDYFLIGNLLSLLIAFGDVALIQKIGRIAAL
ncbi:MAG: hypothetical protein AB7I48_20060 [Planctomycetaceae bacterium]